MNGEALRYTCCNRRAHQTAGGRDTNGCTSAFHCGGRSAWQRHSTVSRSCLGRCGTTWELLLRCCCTASLVRQCRRLLPAQHVQQVRWPTACWPVQLWIAGSEAA